MTFNFLESVSLDPFNLDADDPLHWLGQSINLDKYIKEATSDVKAEGIMSRIWNVIKNIFKVIAAQCRRIWNAFISIFKSNQTSDTTLDDIANSVLNNDMDLAPEDKHMQFRFTNNREIRIRYLGNEIAGTFSKPKIPGHDPDDRPEQKAIMLIFHILKKPYLLDQILDMLKSIKRSDNEVTFKASELSNAIDEVWAGLVFGINITCTLEEWTKLNERIIRLNREMQTIDDQIFGSRTFSFQKSEDKKEFIILFNKLSQLASLLQKGINAIGDGMRQIYKLSDQYENKINSSNYQQFLPAFVKGCVEHNIPSKYVCYAIRQICDKSINALPNNPNIKAPPEGYVKGNGRFVIFPGDPKLKDHIIKIAYNGLGVRGNRNEFVVWKAVEDIPEIANELYHIYDIGDRDNYVIETDRATPIDHYDKCEEWNKRMKQMCLDNDIGFIIRCNDGGFGALHGKVICIDYGNVHRVL